MIGRYIDQFDLSSLTALSIPGTRPASCTRIWTRVGGASCAKLYNALIHQVVGERSTLGNVPPASLLSRSLPRSETGTSESYREQDRKTAHHQQCSIQERLGNYGMDSM
jgi:hypothetical protein